MTHLANIAAFGDRRARFGADARAEYGLSRLALRLPEPWGGARLARRGRFGFIVYVLFAAFGVTALLFAVPYAHDALRFTGAAYLAYLAWGALRPGGASPFQMRELPPDSPRRLFATGLLTSLLNPKIAALYLSLLPQFVDRASGDILRQTLRLGALQVAISVTVNAFFVLTAGGIAACLARRPLWAPLQRWLMGCVLAGLAIRVAFDSGRR